MRHLAVFVASREMSRLDKSRKETMASIIYMANAVGKMIDSSEERALRFINERGPFGGLEAALNE